MILLRQSTVATVTLPPLLDSTDGNTLETGLTVNATDIYLSKAGAAMAAKTDATAPTIDPTTANLRVTLDATDTATLGVLVIHSHPTGALYVERAYEVVPANVYDSLVSGSDYLQADAVQVEGVDATDQVNAACDTAISDAALATAASLATVGTNVDSVLADTGTDGVVVAAASKTGYSLSSAGIQALWDALTSALTTVGSVGKVIVDNLNATVSSRASQTTADAIEVDTQDLQSRTPAALVGGRIDANIGAVNNTAVTGDGSATRWGPA